MKRSTKRNVSMDFIRCIAYFSVISVHFLLNNGFYNEIVVGRRMFVMTLMRSSFMICVPLFLLLSGYLMRNKKLSCNYYLKLTKTLAIYIIASICCIAYKRIVLNQEISILNAIAHIFSFSAAPYSWYVEMYIGLFLMIPFLNILYNNLPSQWAKLLLVITFLFCSSAPSVLNIFRFNDCQWWLAPSSANNYNVIVPDWWINIYPISYYFIGCYLSEYPWKIGKFKHACLIIIAMVLFGMFNYYRSYNSTFIKGAWAQWGSLLIVVQTVLVFTFFEQRNYDNLPSSVCKVLAYISDWSLGAYLVSWIFDKKFYSILNNHQPNMILRLEYFIIIVPLVSVCSLLLSALITQGYGLIAPHINKITQKITKSII